jgi:hypothetical protein
MREAHVDTHAHTYTHTHAHTCHQLEDLQYPHHQTFNLMLINSRPCIDNVGNDDHIIF